MKFKCIHSGYKVLVSPNPRVYVEFVDGVYETNDKQIIKLLKKHEEYGKIFTAVEEPKTKKKSSKSKK